MTLKGKVHLMIDRCRHSVNRGPWILGITFFTALWILYVPRCALSAATETKLTNNSLAKFRCDGGRTAAVTVI